MDVSMETIEEDTYKNFLLIKLELPDWAVLFLANTRKVHWHIEGDS